MDINSVYNTQFQSYLTETQRQQSTIDSFQSILERRLAENPAVGLTEKEDKELREACQMMESYFIQMMFRELRKTSLDDKSFIPKSNAEKIFIDMMDEEVSKSSAKAGGIGLAEMMYRQMTSAGPYQTVPVKPAAAEETE